jgi:hypothetical protein
MCPPRRPIMSNHTRKRATRARSIKGPGEGASAAQLTLAPRMLGYCLTHTWTMPAKASRTAARTKHRPTEAAWAIWSGSNSGLSVEILMLPGVHPSRGRVEHF